MIRKFFNQMENKSSSSSLLFFFFFFFLFLVLPNKLSAQPYTNISLGTTFTPLAPPSLSPSGDFAFGFRPLEANTSLFLLAVWFDKIPDKTVVWTANRDTPVAAQSTAELTAGGQLSLQDPSGQEIWRANITASATYASMLDTGNFILAGADTGAVWESFGYPTDTILPGQVLSQPSTLYAKLMDDDYSTGRFEFTLQEDGNLVMYPVAYPSKNWYGAYWALMSFGSGIHLVFNEITGSLYLSLPNNSRIPVLPEPAVTGENYTRGTLVLPEPAVTGDNYLRATLDPDGVFRQYAFPKGNSLLTERWTVKNTTASDICNKNFPTGSGSCGFNSYRILDSEGKSNCQCPPYYSFADPTRKYKGCKPDFVAPSCEPGGEKSINFTVLDNVDWPLSDAEQFSPMNETECTDNCLQDCFCFVAIYNNGNCWKKKFPLSSGRMRSDVNRKAFIKYSTVNSSSMFTAPPPPPPPPPPPEGQTDWKAWVIVVSAILAGSVVLNLVQIGASCFVYRNIQRVQPPNSSSAAGPVLRSFTYKELEEATKGFSEELGKGAFGTVYKGALPSQPTTLIAVKKLEESLLEEAEREFTNEVTTIGQTHHKNLVRLLGFCKEGARRLIVFEFMSKGSLNKFVFGSDRPEWNQRVQITLGIARGLAYLHEECRTQIIHCDIKPQNILLDDNLEARISDFGLAKLLRLDQTRTSTGIRGTIGYFAPEWFKNVAITAKVDVYSFGVMLLEMICCRRNFEWGMESQERTTVVDWAKECCRNGRLDLLVGDEEEAKMDGMRLERFVMVGISCIQDEPWLRPSMKKVVQMLEGSIAVPMPPNMHSIRS